jgi:UDP-3-O-[3-hydroxymyristoyl] N-acetylglucosamine deacetylase
MDGSASPFVFLIQSAGILEQDAAKKFIRIKHRVAINRWRQGSCFPASSGVLKSLFAIDFGPSGV